MKPNQTPLQLVSQVLSDVFPWVVPRDIEPFYKNQNGFYMKPCGMGKPCFEVNITNGSILFHNLPINTPDIKVSFKPGDVADTIGAVSFIVDAAVKLNPEGFPDCPFLMLPYIPSNGWDIFSPSGCARRKFRPAGQNYFPDGPWEPVNDDFIQTVLQLAVPADCPGIPSCVGYYLRNHP
jgi:hypothetical protein